MAISTYLSMILRLNGLNSAMKRDRKEWMNRGLGRKRPIYMLSTEIYFRYKSTHKLKVKG